MRNEMLVVAVLIVYCLNIRIQNYFLLRDIQTLKKQIALQKEVSK